MASAATDLLELTEENVEKVLDEVGRGLGNILQQTVGEAIRGQVMPE